MATITSCVPSQETPNAFVITYDDGVALEKTLDQINADIGFQTARIADCEKVLIQLRAEKTAIENA